MRQNYTYGRRKVFPLGGAMLNVKLWEMPSQQLIVILVHLKLRKVSPLGGVYLSFRLIWGECRRHDLLLSNKFKTAKRGLIRLKIRQNCQIIDL